ncbi:RNA-dependent RNA polymerase [Heracleum sosnowskyi]|uniref:RNA-dependent RNA polymerase n=1 Tax=Heracleum sosnowskyi TaxID=360622 RepID=A0AAD8HN02_9APIA|nr:RNA-dependent RNA polymerase [Heracleum sosnowskyi]
MVNESMGTICNAHVVHADSSDYGAMDENCIVLADRAAKAVDFPKTGNIVNMPSHLKPKLYPDYMGKEDFQSYRSTKILGRLYRKIKDDHDIELTDSMEINFLVTQ